MKSAAQLSKTANKLRSCSCMQVLRTSVTSLMFTVIVSTARLNSQIALLRKGAQRHSQTGTEKRDGLLPTEGWAFLTPLKTQDSSSQDTTSVRQRSPLPTLRVGNHKVLTEQPM